MKKSLLTVLFASLMGLAFGGCSLITPPDSGSSDTSSSDVSSNVSSSDVSSSDSSSAPIAHEHDYATSWSYDKENHWHACKDSTCSATTDKAAHVFDDGVETTAPTCNKEGVKTFTCECGYQKTEPIAKSNHVAATEWSTDEEYHWHACTTDGCKHHLDEAEHTWTDGEKKDGKWYVKCSDCGYEKEDETFHYRLYNNKISFGTGKYALVYNGTTLTPDSEGVYDLVALITDLTESTDVELTLQRLLSDGKVGDTKTITWTSPAVGKEINNFGSAAGVNAFKAASGNENAEYLASKADGNGVTKNGVVCVELDGKWPNIYFGDPIATQPDSATYTHIVFTLYFENSNAARIDLARKGTEGTVGQLSIIDGWYDYWVPVDAVDFDSFDVFFMMPQSADVNVIMNGKMYVDGIRYEKAPDTVTGEGIVNTFTTIGDALAGGYNTYFESKTDNKDVTKNGVVVFDIDKNRERTWPNVFFGSALCEKPADGTYKYVVATMYFENTNATRLALARKDKTGELGSIDIVDGWHDYWIPYDVVTHDFDQFFFMPQQGGATATITGKIWIDSIRYEKEDYATVSDDGILTVGTQNTYEVVANDQVLTAEADGTYDLKKLRPEGILESYDTVVTVIRKVDGAEVGRTTYTWSASKADYEINCVGSQAAFDRLTAANYGFGVYNAEKTDGNGVTKNGVYSIDLSLFNTPWPNVRLGVPFCSAEDYAKYDNVVITYYLEGGNANVFKVFIPMPGDTPDIPYTNISDTAGWKDGWKEYRISTKDITYEQLSSLVLFPYASEAIVNGTLHIDSVKLEYAVTASQEDGKLTVGDGEYSVFYKGQSVPAETDGTYDLTKLIEDDGNGFTLEVTVNRVVNNQIVATKTITWHKEGTRDQSVLNGFDNAWEAEKAGYTTFADEVTDPYGVKKTGVVSMDPDGLWPNIKFGSPLCLAPTTDVYTHVVFTLYFENTNATRFGVMVQGLEGEQDSMNIVSGWHEYWVPVSIAAYENFTSGNFFLMPQQGSAQVEISGKVYIDSVRYATAATSESGENVINNFSNVTDAVRAGYTTFMSSKTDIYGVTKTGVVALEMGNRNDAWPHIYFGAPLCAKVENYTNTYIVATMYFEGTNANKVYLASDAISGTHGELPVVSGWHEYWIRADLSVTEYDLFSQFFFMPNANDQNVTGKVYVDSVRYETVTENGTDDGVINDFANVSHAVKGGFNTFVSEKTDGNGVTKTGVVVFDIEGKNDAWPNIKFGAPLCAEPEEGTYTHIVVTMYFDKCNATRFGVMVQGLEGEQGSIDIVEGWHEYRIPVSIATYERITAGTFFLMPQKGYEQATITGKVYIDDIRYEKAE